MCVFDNFYIILERVEDALKRELKNINIYKQDPSSGVRVKLDKDQTLSSLLEEKGEEDLLELLFNCDLQTGKPCWHLDLSRICNDELSQQKRLPSLDTKSVSID